MIGNMSKKQERLRFVQQKIEEQENAIVTCSEREFPTHNYLLQKLTDEWCKLIKELTPEQVCEALELV